MYIYIYIYICIYTYIFTYTYIYLKWAPLAQASALRNHDDCFSYRSSAPVHCRNQARLARLEAATMQAASRY